MDNDEYQAYLAKCKEKGFTVNGQKSDSSYYAYNKDGYKLSLLYVKNSKELKISLDAPIKMSNYKWPDSEIAKLLPVPKSNIGNINTDDSDSFAIYVGETSLDEYNDYVKNCSEKGFNVDYSKHNNYYEAKNTDDYSLRVDYEENNIMYISINSPKETLNSETVTEKSKKSAENTENSKADDKGKANSDSKNNIVNNDVSPEFKSAMDNYEKFIDEYIAFMEKYKNSDNPIDMLSDYNDYMNKYTETIKKLDEINQDELSPADYAYFLEVNTRITQKLLDMSTDE